MNSQGLTQAEQNAINGLPFAIATESVSNDDPALSLMEVDYVRPDGKGWHRYEIINVMQGDKKVRFMRDMGPREAFPAYGTRIISGGTRNYNGDVRYWSEETVGYIRDSANDLRKHDMAKEMNVVLSEGFKENYEDTLQRKRDRVKHPKDAQFGYGKTVNAHGK